MKGYPTIYGPYRRHVDGPDRNKLIVGEWTYPEFELLKDVPWNWTEKIDGTNIRVGGDGHGVFFGGRTDAAQIPVHLLDVLMSTFTEELFEQEFGEKELTLYGEGFGPKINNGGKYRETPGFALFDVLVGEHLWLQPNDVAEVAMSLGIESVPQLVDMSLIDAIGAVESGVTSHYADFPAEGLVGVAGGLCNRHGQRIQVKVKSVDFYEG